VCVSSLIGRNKCKNIWNLKLMYMHQFDYSVQANQPTNIQTRKHLKSQVDVDASIWLLCSSQSTYQHTNKKALVVTRVENKIEQHKKFKI